MTIVVESHSESTRPGHRPRYGQWSGGSGSAHRQCERRTRHGGSPASIRRHPLPHLPDLPQRFACGLARVMFWAGRRQTGAGLIRRRHRARSHGLRSGQQCARYRSGAYWQNCSRYRGRRSCHPWPPRPASRATANSGSSGCYRASSDARERRRGPAIDRRQPTKCLPGMPDVVIAYSRLQIPRQSGRMHLEM